MPPFSGLSQRVVIVCYEMGAPYFKVRRGTRPRARGLWARGPWGEREREDPREWGFTQHCNRWMKSGPVCGCQSSKASGDSRPGARLSFLAKRGDHQRWAWERSPPRCGGSSLPGFSTRIKASAEKKRVSWLSGKKRKFIRGKRGVTGS